MFPPTVTKDQILSIAGGMVNIKYFDEQTGQWGMRRPSATSAAQPPKAFAMCNVSLGNSDRSGSDSERCLTLGEILTQHSPMFVTLLEMTDSFFAAVQQLAVVRRWYALTDLVRCSCTMDGGIRGAEPTIAEHGCVFLIRKPVHVDFAECQPRLFGDKSKQPPRPFVLLHMRNFFGNSCTIGAAHFDPCATAAERCAAVTAAIGKLDSADIVALAGNFGDHVTDVKDQDLRRELTDLMRHHQMMDSFETCMETVNTAPVSLWFKEAPCRAVPQSVAPLSGDRRWCRFGSVIQVQLRSAAAGGGNATLQAPPPPPPPPPSGNPPTPSGIAIPQPRSAKVVAKGSPSPTVLADPAVLAIDEKLPASNASVQNQAGGPTPSPSTLQATGTRDGINVAAMFPSAVKPRQLRFRKDSAFHVKGSNRNFSSDEAQYDLSSHFSSVAEALDTINSGAFKWLADYFVVNHTILAAEHVSQCDLKGFRRYAQSKPNPWSLLKQAGGGAAREGADRADGASDRGASGSHTSGGVNVAQLLVEKVRKEAATRLQTQADDTTAAPPYGAPDASTGRGSHGNSKHTSSTNSAHHAPAAHTLALHSQGPVSRPRVWAEACCTLLYQVTPKEMKFDISSLVGVTKGNLKLAITRLNTKKTMAAALSEKPDPLLDYGYDYALLYCPERQGYWLLAATDVPCDVVACRHAAS